MTDVQGMKRYQRRTLGSAPYIIAFLATNLLLASACSTSDDRFGGSVRVALFAAPTGFHPLLDRGVVGQLLFNGLVKPSESLEYIPDIATKWHVSNDGLTWEFELRDDVYFHDGEQLTSRDVEFTLQEVQGERSYSLGPLYRIITSVEAVSDYRVKLTLAEPYAPVLSILTIEILPAHLLEDADDSAIESFRWNPVGTGPFQFVGWDGNETVSVEANPDYFAGRPYLDSIDIVSFPTKTSAWSDLMQGQIDVVMDLNQEDFEIISQDERYEAHGYLDWFYYTVLFNLDDPLYGDPVVREALNLAIDREELVDETLGGFAQITTGPFRPGTWPYDESVEIPVYSPERAISMLGELGFSDSDDDSILERDGEELVLKLLVDEGDDQKQAVAQRIKWQLFLIGVRVEVEFLSFDELLGRRLYPGDFQATLLQFNSGDDPELNTRLFWHSDQIGASNLARYSNPRVDALLDSGKAESDQTGRTEIYHELHREFANDLPALFLFVRRIYLGTSAKIRGIAAQPNWLFQIASSWTIE